MKRSVVDLRPGEGVYQTWLEKYRTRDGYFDR
jgi:hypothetical protein